MTQQQASQKTKHINCIVEHGKQQKEEKGDNTNSKTRNAFADSLTPLLIIIADQTRPLATPTLPRPFIHHLLTILKPTTTKTKTNRTIRKDSTEFEAIQKDREMRITSVWGLQLRRRSISSGGTGVESG